MRGSMRRRAGYGLRATGYGLLLAAANAHGGGLERPSGISARGVGMGGAFAAWADDATAVYFDPAALDDTESHVLVGGELVLNPRSYTPLADDGTHGDAQKATVVAPLPAAGAVGRFTYDDRPSRFTLGAGVWNTFGGQVSFPRTGMPALDSTQDAALEVDAGTALRISDRFAIGAAFRFGIGLFSIDSTMLPYDAHLSASGVGVATGWGALVRPTPTTRIALAWRTPLRIATSGSGTITFSSGAMQEQIHHDQIWPQQVSLGGGWQVAALRLAAQIDWTQWSQVHELAIRFPANASLDQVYPENWSDSWTLRAGGEYRLDRVALRAGAYLDTNAVPDRTLERQYLDSDKLGLSTGLGLRAAAWRADAAVDFVVPTTRTVPNNTAATAAFPADRNKAPGDYSGFLLTFELALARSF